MPHYQLVFDDGREFPTETFWASDSDAALSQARVRLATADGAKRVVVGRNGIIVGIESKQAEIHPHAD